MLLKFKCHLNLNVIETKMSPKNLKVTNKMSLKKCHYNKNMKYH